MLIPAIRLSRCPPPMRSFTSFSVSQASCATTPQKRFLPWSLTNASWHGSKKPDRPSFNSHWVLLLKKRATCRTR